MHIHVVAMMRISTQTLWFMQLILSTVQLPFGLLFL